MHNTTLPLGRYSKDPRFTIVKVNGQDAIRTDRVTITKSADRFNVWTLDGPYEINPAYWAKTLTQALGYDLGDPAKVGPSGIGSWLHTDGRLYAHDPATTGMRPAEFLRPGDVVDFPHLPAFEILGPAESLVDELARGYMAYPVRRLDGGFNGHFSYRSGDMAPVRFAR